MVATVEKSGSEQVGYVFDLHRPIGNAATAGLHLHQRLEPEQAARSGAHDLHRLPAPGGLLAYGARYRLRAQRQRGRLTRYVQGGHRDAHALPSAPAAELAAAELAAAELAGVTGVAGVARIS